MILHGRAAVSRSVGETKKNLAAWSKKPSITTDVMAQFHA